MSKVGRSEHRRVILIVVLGLSVAIAGCGGGSGIPGNAVVEVGGNSITKAVSNHWMSVAAVSNKTSATAKVVVPDPPNYTACVANLAATAPKPAKGQPKLTPVQLKIQCAQQYKLLQAEVLNFLIGLEWVLGEARAKGVKVSDA